MADMTSPQQTNEERDQTQQVRPGLTRSRDRRIVAGVADGLAAAWGFRPWLVRLGFVATTALAGLGVVLYLAGWMLMPEEGQPESIAQRMVRRMNLQRNWIGFGLLLLGGLIVGRIADIDVGVLVAGALLITGYALYRGDLLDVGTTAADEGDGPAPIYQRPARPRPLRPKSYLGRLTVGGMLVTLGVMAALDAAGVTRPTSRHYAAAAVLVIGTGLAVGTILGRSRGLIALGLLLTPVLALAAIADHRFSEDWQYLTVRDDTLDSLQPSYRFEAGALTIDLTNVPFDGETVHLDLDVGIGEIFVRVPTNVAVDASANVVLGEARVAGQASTGLGAEVIRATPGSAGTVTINADVRIGRIEIYQDEVFESSPVVDGAYVEVPRGMALIAPRAIRDVAGVYNLLGGDLVLDLSQVAGGRARLPINITGLGSARIIVPSGAPVTVTSSLPIIGEPDSPQNRDGMYIYERAGTGIRFVINADGVSITIEEA